MCLCHDSKLSGDIPSLCRRTHSGRGSLGAVGAPRLAACRRRLGNALGNVTAWGWPGSWAPWSLGVPSKGAHSMYSLPQHQTIITLNKPTCSLHFTICKKHSAELLSICISLLTCIFCPLFQTSVCAVSRHQPVLQFLFISPSPKFQGCFNSDYHTIL